MRAFGKARRGRPKAMAAAVDRGTEEIQCKRQMLADGGDLRLVSDPLDCMLARGLIDDAAHAAGRHYAMLYRLAVGRTQQSFARFYEALAGSPRVRRAPFDEERLAAFRQQYHVGKNCLKREGAFILNATENIAVFGFWPDFLLRASAANDNGALLPVTCRSRDKRAHAANGDHVARAVRTGLGALQRCYGTGGHTSAPRVSSV